MSKKRSLFAAATGAALAYFMDPNNGAGRRARLRDQAASRWRDMRSATNAQLEYRKGVARGMIHEARDTFRPDREFDDQTLTQKVRSEAMGPWRERTSHQGELHVRVSDGVVTLEGTIDETERDHLLRLVEQVEGVRSVDDRTTRTS